MEIEKPNSDNPPWRLCPFLLALIIFCMFAAQIYFMVYAVIFIIGTPDVSAPIVRVDSASFTSLDDAIGPNLNAKFDITLIFTNPNKKYNLSYDNIQASLNNHGEEFPGHYGWHLHLFAYTRLPPFFQLNQSENRLQFQMNVVDQFVGNDIIAARAKERMDFGLQLYAPYGAGDRIFLNKFYCKHLVFVFKSKNDTFASGTCL